MPTEVALDFSNDVGLLLLVDVPALFVVFCVVEAVCKKELQIKANDKKIQTENKNIEIV